ncbi:hypothetical protein AB0425_38335 [Actinosynnema sp. NPDC051121]
MTAVIGAMVVCGVLLWPGGDESSSPGRATASSTSPGPTTSRQEEAGQVAAALGRLAVDPESLIASTARDQFSGRAREAIPPGATVEVDERSWSPDGVGGGAITVTVTVPGQGTAEYVAIVIKEGSEWKVAATVPVTGQAPPETRAPPETPTR